MSWQPCDNPATDDSARCAPVQMTIVPQARDLGGFEVRRVLPSVQRRMVGAFIFLDQLSDLFFADVPLDAGARLAVDAAYEDRAAYLLEGTLEVDGTAFEPGRLLVLAPNHQVVVNAGSPARFVVLGGEPMDGPRHIWWNFVASRPERIEQAKADWNRNRFDLVVPGETEFIPLPDGP